jgi:RHS repeat-associated protein
MSTATQLSENSHQGFDGLKAALCLESMKAKSNTAPGMPVCLWRNCIGSNCSGKERDAETRLDFFEARYYSAAQGRFTIPDWSAKPQPVPYAKLDNPQTLNLYAYVRNDPLSRIDPDGHIDCSGKNAEGAGCQAILGWNAEHGISSTAQKSDFPGTPVVLPNGASVPDPKSPTGKMMAPVADLRPVAAAGREAKRDIKQMMLSGDGSAVLGFLAGALGSNVGTGGQFDYQRMGPQSDILTGGFQQLRQFKAVSNFNVGLFAQQAGLTIDDLKNIGGAFFKAFSTNKDRSGPNGIDPETYHFWVEGFQAGGSGVYGY